MKHIWRWIIRKVTASHAEINGHYQYTYFTCGRVDKTQPGRELAEQNALAQIPNLLHKYLIIIFNIKGVIMSISKIYLPRYFFALSQDTHLPNRDT